MKASKPCSLTTDSRARASRTDRSNRAGSISTVYFARSAAAVASSSAWAISPKRTATFSGSSGQTTGPMSWRRESPSNIRSVIPSKGCPTRAIRAVRRRRRTAAAAIVSATFRRPSGSSSREVTIEKSRPVRRRTAVSSGIPAIPELSITTSKPSDSPSRLIRWAFQTRTGAVVSMKQRAGTTPLV